MRRKRYRRNADEGIRRSRRDDPVANLLARARAGQLKPENIYLAGYLGDPIAQQVFPPPYHMTPDPVFSDGSRAVEILNKAGIGQREAVLFVADCATRALNDFAVNGESEIHIEGLAEAAYQVVESARSWVNGSGLILPESVADDLQDFEGYRRVRRYSLSAYSQAIETAYYVGAGCQRQPANLLREVPLKMAGCYRQHFFDEENLEAGGPGHGANQNDVTDETRRAAWDAYREELAWADDHLARCLLSEVWPTIELEG